MKTELFKLISVSLKTKKTQHTSHTFARTRGKRFLLLDEELKELICSQVPVIRMEENTNELFSLSILFLFI